MTLYSDEAEVEARCHGARNRCAGKVANTIVPVRTGDLNRRRAIIAGTEERGNTRIVTAEAPLSEMFGYATNLRGMSQGRATYAMGPLE